MRPNAFSIVHVAVALFLVMIFVAIMLPTISGSRPAPRMQNSTQLRGIHQGLVIYANSNRNFFPGLDDSGEEDTQVLDWSEWHDEDIPPTQVSLAVDKRFAILLHGDYLTPEYLISPFESDPNIEPWPEEGAFTTGHYSYSMLQIPDEGGRRAEWSQTLNSQAIVVSDRNTGSAAKPLSLYADSGEGWRGALLWNDNHVVFENTDEFETKYGADELNEADRLFEADGTEDALMIHSGNRKG
jgi:hypothetical protein